MKDIDDEIDEELEDEEELEAEYPWLIKANGEQDWPKPANQRRFKLDELKKFVGGKVEIHPTPREGSTLQTFMAMNENGSPLHLDLNHNASLIMGQPIFGDVIICHAMQLPN